MCIVFPMDLEYHSSLPRLLEPIHKAVDFEVDKTEWTVEQPFGHLSHRLYNRTIIDSKGSTKRAIAISYKQCGHNKPGVSVR